MRYARNVFEQGHRSYMTPQRIGGRRQEYEWGDKYYHEKRHRIIIEIDSDVDLDLGIEWITKA